MPFGGKKLVFLDYEMTGLVLTDEHDTQDDPVNDRLLEVAVVVVSADLETYVDGPQIAIYQPKKVIDRMDAWNKNVHGKSGLLQRVAKSTKSEVDAEEEILRFISKYVPKNGSPLCGNVTTQDRKFMFKYMPQLHAYFHYQDFDVNFLQIAANLWREDVPVFPRKNAHSARDDIHEAIAKLKYYRAKMMR